MLAGRFNFAAAKRQKVKNDRTDEKKLSSL